MIAEDLPVKMDCPISNIEEDVFFHPVQMDGKWYISIDSFNGCCNSWHACKECETCKTAAYAKLMKTDS